MNKKNQKNWILGIYTVTLVATALIGTAFCAYAAIILIPALVPILIIATKKLTKSLKKQKLNLA